MTSPEDEDPEESLRRALSEAVSGVEPGADGLDKIRARIGNRPPRPWPLSVLFGLIDRVRNWTWHGHWAWQDSLPRPRAFWRPRSRRSNFPGWGTGGLRLVTVLAGIAVIAGISLPNEASVKLHEKFGMKQVAHLKEVGFKFGEWVDTGYWEIIINE